MASIRTPAFRLAHRPLRAMRRRPWTSLAAAAFPAHSRAPPSDPCRNRLLAMPPRAAMHQRRRPLPARATFRAHSRARGPCQGRWPTRPRLPAARRRPPSPRAAATSQAHSRAQPDPRRCHRPAPPRHLITRRTARRPRRRGGRRRRAARRDRSERCLRPSGRRPHPRANRTARDTLRLGLAARRRGAGLLDRPALQRRPPRLPGQPARGQQPRGPPRYPPIRRALRPIRSRPP